MNTIAIKEITAEHIKEYKEFLTSELPSEQENFGVTPEEEANAPFPTKDTEDSFTLGAFIDKELIGVVSFTRDSGNKMKLKHKGRLIRMFIAKNHRGRGIGKLLVEELLKRVRKIDDIEQVTLTVVVSNAAAKSLYQKFGFVSYGVEEHAIKWKGKYFDDDLMVLWIKRS